MIQKAERRGDDHWNAEAEMECGVEASNDVAIDPGINPAAGGL